MKLRNLLRVGLKLLHFVYFPDEFIVYSDVLVRAVFTLYYLPIMAIALALTHSVLQALVYTKIVPLARELEFQHTIERESIPALTSFLYSLVLQMMPFVMLGACVATLCHKAINGIGEAMVDAFSRVDDKDYPLFAARFEYMMQKRGRQQILAASCVCLLVGVGVVFYTNLLFAWSAREPGILLSAWSIIFSQMSFIFYTALVRPRSASSTHDTVHSSTHDLDSSNYNNNSLLSFFVGRWWRSTVHRIRHLSMEMVLCCGFYWFVTRGFVDSMSMCVEVLLYLNLPHLFGFLVLSFSVSAARALQSFFWLNRHRNRGFRFLLLILPQQTAMMVSLIHFEFDILATMFFSGMSVMLWSRAIQLLREYETSDVYGGCVSWREAISKKPIPPHLAAVLEDAFERQHPIPSMVSLDVSLDLLKMTMTPRHGSPLKIERLPAAPSQVGGTLNFLKFALPRLITLQSAAVFGGRRFRNVRIFLRTFTVTLLLVFVGIVAGVVTQAVFPPLRPVPVVVHRVTQDQSTTLTVDHFVLNLKVFASNNHTDDKNHNQRDLYPGLCTKNFHGINVWELSWLSTAAYISDETSLQKVLDFMAEFMGTDWVPHFPREISSSYGSAVWDGFIEFYSPSRNVSVVSVRGTDLTSFADALQDVNVFFEVALYHTLASVVPGASLLPSSLVSDFIKLASGVDSLSGSGSWEPMWIKNMLGESTSPSDPSIPSGEYQQDIADRDPSLPNYELHAVNSREYFSGVYQYVRHLKNRTSHHSRHVSANIVLTGHSLGGAVAHIVGTKLGILSMGFNSPGILLSHKKFGVDLSSIHQFTTTLISSHDIVPTIGGQGGELFHLECVAEKRELCHAMEFVVGALWHSCGSVRRSFSNISDVLVK